MCVAFMTEENRQNSPNTKPLMSHIYLHHKVFWVTEYTLKHRVLRSEDVVKTSCLLEDKPYLAILPDL